MLWLLMLLPGNYDMVKAPEIKQEIQIPDEVIEKIVKSLESVVVNEDRIREIVREEIRDALKTTSDEKESTSASKEDGESEKAVQEEVKEEAKVDDPGLKPSESDLTATPGIKSSKSLPPGYILYLYKSDGCGLCKKSYDELQAYNGIKYQLYIGNYPAPYRDGSEVPKYPSYELYKDGQFVSRWEGYTRVDVILGAIAE